MTERDDTINNARILVTGASGLMGGGLASSLATHNEVIAAARWGNEEARERIAATGATPVVFDLAEPSLGALPDSVDYVFHCGAGLPGTMTQAELFEVNVQATGRLMSRFRTARSFVHCSSASVYAHQSDHPYVETDLLGVDRHPILDYPLSKIAGEQLVQFLSSEFGLPTVILRIFALYGTRGGFPTMLIEKVAKGEPVPLPPERPLIQNPIFERDFVAKAIAAALIADVPPVVINFAGSESTSVEDYTALAGEMVGARVDYVDIPAGFAPSPADLTAMEAAVGATSTSVRDGVAEVLRSLRT